MTKDQMKRAGDYVLGLMDDGERSRAERDLEVDPGFRNAVLRVAGRMHFLDVRPISEAAPADNWKTIAACIAELPHIGGVRPTDPALAAERAGDEGRSTATVRPAGPYSVPRARAGIIATGLIAACAAGYVAGLATARFWQ